MSGLMSGHAAPSAVVGVAVSNTAISMVVVIARLYARLRIASNAGLDDLFIGISLFFAIATTVAQTYQVSQGMGRHQNTIHPHEAIAQLKGLYVSIWCYNLSLSFTKFSILKQYLRIFPQRKFRIACYTILALVIVYSCYTFFTAIFICTPISSFWIQGNEGGKCLNRTTIWLLNSGLNIASDIVIAVLPLPIFNQLELPKRQKRVLMLVFGLGGFTCIVSILRLQSLIVVSRARDVSWENPLAAIWSNVEINIAIICSCIPTLRCIFPKIFRSQLSASRSNSHDEESRLGQWTSKIFSRKTQLSCTGTESTHTHTDRRKSLEAFGRGLYESSAARTLRQKTTCKSTTEAEVVENIEISDWAAAPGERGEEISSWSLPRGVIHVTTAVEQEVEIDPGKNDSMSSQGAGGYAESTRDLVTKK